MSAAVGGGLRSRGPPSGLGQTADLGALPEEVHRNLNCERPCPLGLSEPPQQLIASGVRHLPGGER